MLFRSFTSKDFRFKQRVWFLKDKPSVCPGCSTGCSVDVYAKPEVRTYFRLKPRESEANGHWMCDVGRDTYKHMNQDQRLRTAIVKDDKGASRRVRFAEGVAALATKLATVTPATCMTALYTKDETQTKTLLASTAWSKAEGVEEIATKG